MTRLPISVSVPGGDLVGWVDGEGPKVLLLHGGPVGYEYLETLAVELLPGFTVAAYQQRGLDPSTNLGPFDAGTQAADSAAVLDVLGWSQAYVIGHPLVLRQNPVTHGPIHAGVFADMPALAAWLPQARVVLEFVHGAASPMPLSASTDTVELLAHADLEVVEGAGHFIWFERPGTIRAALERLVGRASQTSLDDVVDVEGAI